MHPFNQQPGFIGFEQRIPIASQITLITFHPAPGNSLRVLEQYYRFREPVHQDAASYS